MDQYVELTNVRTWYDERGSGDPLVLLHGGVVDARFFADNIDALADRFHVYALDLRGHGHTADVEGPFSTEMFAQDTIDFVEKVIGGPAHLVGHSVGAATSLFVALRRPDLVDKLVMVSGGFHHSGEIGAGGGEIPDVTPVVEAFGAQYGEVSPDGEDHYPVVVRKVFEMATHDPALTPDEVGAVQARTLVMIADDDIVTFDHTLALYDAIPDSELAVVPGTSHFLLQEKPELCNTLILQFLENAPVPTIAPVRRAGA